MLFNLSKRKIKQNILFWYQLSPLTGQNWYSDANLFCLQLSEKYNIPLFKVVGIVAALSPLKYWEQNKSIAEKFLFNPTRNGLHFDILYKKCVNIYYNCNDEKEVINELKGLKIQSFFTNIYYVHKCNTVTIDRHIIKLCVPDVKSTIITNKQYKFLSTCLLEVSQKVDINASQLQSIVWVNYKANKTKLKL